MTTPKKVSSTARILLALVFLILIGIFLTGFLLPVNPTNSSSSADIQLKARTPTPTLDPTLFPQQVIVEGRPSGIIVGAIVMALIIIGGTLFTLLRQKQP